MKTYVKTDIRVDLSQLRAWYEWLLEKENPVKKSWKTDYGSDYFEAGSEGFGWSLHDFEMDSAYHRVEWEDPQTINDPMLRSKGTITFEDGHSIPVCNRHYTKQRDIVKDNYAGKILDFFGGSYRGIVWAIKPSFKFVPHVDFPRNDTYRVHIPIHTNNHSFFEIGGEKFNIPADGYVWLINTGDHEHTAWNYGTESRVHLYLQMPLATFDQFSETSVRL